jgi:hypothetical protein
VSNAHDEASENVAEAVVDMAEETAKTLSDLQSAVRDFADKYLSVTSLDTKRDAFEWVQAGSTLAVDAWTLWLRGAVLVTGRAATITSDVAASVGQAMRQEGESGGAGGGFVFFGRRP